MNHELWTNIKVFKNTVLMMLDAKEQRPTIRVLLADWDSIKSKFIIMN